MDRKTKRLLVFVVLLFAAAALWTLAPHGAKQAAREYLAPTSVEVMPLPDGCIQKDGVPPASLLSIVERQRASYHLSLQKVAICQTTQTFRSQEDLVAASLSLEMGKLWLPLYIGCCSYQFRRHVVVLAADATEKGSLVIEASLVQSRWDFLRLNWTRDRSSWF
jgi:hypothetical protein